MARDVLAAVLGSVYLLIYIVLLHYRSEETMIMCLFSPIVIAIMAYVILKDGHYKGKLLNDEEFGYADKNKEDLWIV